MAALIEKLGQVSGCFGVLWVFFYVEQLEDYALAHYCALDACTAMVTELLLIFFYSLPNPKPQNLPRRRITQTKHPLNSLASILHFLDRKIILIQVQSTRVIFLEIIFDYWLFFILTLSHQQSLGRGAF